MLNQRKIIAVAGDKHHDIKPWREFDGIHRDANVPVAFLYAAVENLQVFRFYLKAYFLQSIEKRLLFLDIRTYDVRYRADKAAEVNSFLQDAVVIYLRVVKVLCRIVEVLH